MSINREEQPGNPFLAAVPDSQRLQVRDGVRTQITQAGGVDISTRAAIASNDDPRQLVDQFTHETLSAIEQARLREATLPTQPWAGHYETTLMAAGLLGCR